ncbi:hypothetical protein LSAT2_028571 [Lamellibrachia satsuma]|nr:hypothetical protein LSAT2_028571 [Lamellibrachia satsuma]
MWCDQLLYALAKHIQWAFPNSVGEQRLVMMLGGLHTEKALWSCVGDILECPGWTDLLAEVGAATRGMADSFLKGQRAPGEHEDIASCSVGDAHRRRLGSTKNE